MEWWHENTQNPWEQEGTDLSGMDLEWTSEASVVVAVRDTYCIMLAIFLCGWNRAEAISWFRQESQARPSREAGQLSGEFRLGWAERLDRQPATGRNPAQP